MFGPAVLLSKAEWMIASPFVFYVGEGQLVDCRKRACHLICDITYIIKIAVRANRVAVTD